MTHFDKLVFRVSTKAQIWYCESDIMGIMGIMGFSKPGEFPPPKYCCSEENPPSLFPAVIKPPPFNNYSSWVGIIVLCNGLKILRKFALILQTYHNRFWNQSSETWYMRLIRWFKDGLTFGKLFFDLAYSYSFLKKTRVSNTKTKKNYNTYCSLNLHPNKFPKN